MYQQYFGFAGRPFENTPDPERFFMGKQYRETLAVLMHSVLSRKVLTVITGDIGLGKTTLGRTLLDKLPENTKRVEIIHPRGEPGELLGYVAKTMGVAPTGRSHFELVDALQDALREHAASGGRCVLVIDESQLLNDDHFEEIRLLTNLETNNLKLIQIILLGQLELLKKLQRPNMRPLRQRIAMIKKLQPISPHSTELYVKDRLESVGGSPELFPAETLSEVYRYSRGIPRLINQICDFALVYTFSDERDRVSAGDVRDAAADIGLRGNMEETYVPSGDSHGPRHPMPARLAATRVEPEREEPPSAAESETTTKTLSPPPRIAPASPEDCPAARIPVLGAQPAPTQETAKKRSWVGLLATIIILSLVLLATLLWLHHQGVISLPGLKQPLFADSTTSDRVPEGAATPTEERQSPPAQSPYPSWSVSGAAIGNGSQSVRKPVKAQLKEEGWDAPDKESVPRVDTKGKAAAPGNMQRPGGAPAVKPHSRTSGEKSNPDRQGAVQTGTGIESRVVDAGEQEDGTGSRALIGSINQDQHEPPETALTPKVANVLDASDQGAQKKKGGGR